MPFTGFGGREMHQLEDAVDMLTCRGQGPGLVPLPMVLPPQLINTTPTVIKDAATFLTLETGATET